VLCSTQQQSTSSASVDQKSHKSPPKRLFYGWPRKTKHRTHSVVSEAVLCMFLFHVHDYYFASWEQNYEQNQEHCHCHSSNFIPKSNYRVAHKNWNIHALLTLVLWKRLPLMYEVKGCGHVNTVFKYSS